MLRDYIVSTEIKPKKIEMGDISPSDLRIRFHHLGDWINVLNNWTSTSDYLHEKIIQDLASESEVGGDLEAIPEWKKTIDKMFYEPWSLVRYVDEQVESSVIEETWKYVEGKFKEFAVEYAKSQNSAFEFLQKDYLKQLSEANELLGLLLEIKGSSRHCFEDMNKALMVLIYISAGKSELESGAFEDEGSPIVGVLATSRNTYRFLSELLYSLRKSAYNLEDFELKKVSIKAEAKREVGESFDDVKFDIFFDVFTENLMRLDSELSYKSAWRFIDLYLNTLMSKSIAMAESGSPLSIENLDSFIEYIAKKVTVLEEEIKYNKDLIGDLEDDPIYLKLRFNKEFIRIYRFLIVAARSPETEVILSFEPDHICESCRGGEGGQGDHCTNLEVGERLSNKDILYMESVLQAAKDYNQGEYDSSIKVLKGSLDEVKAIVLPIKVLFDMQFVRSINRNYEKLITDSIGSL